jgi:hypothetical protein
VDEVSVDEVSVDEVSVDEVSVDVEAVVSEEGDSCADVSVAGSVGELVVGSGCKWRTAA